MIRNNSCLSLTSLDRGVDVPDGDKFYQAQIEKHTTLTLTAKEIHEIGLKEVARIEAEMRATKDRAKFEGTMAEFFTFMRTDPQFYAKTPRELLSFSAYVAKKADDKLSEEAGVPAAPAPLHLVPSPMRSTRSTPAAAATLKRA